MREDIYWHFSRHERIAVIILASAIAGVLLFSTINGRDKTAIPVKEYANEIEAFNRTLSERPYKEKNSNSKNKTKKSSEKKKKIYHPIQQQLYPKQRETGD